jgi:hypothetical protein
VGPDTLAQYQRFAALVEQAQSLCHAGLNSSAKSASSAVHKRLQLLLLKHIWTPMA